MFSGFGDYVSSFWDKWFFWIGIAMLVGDLLERFVPRVKKFLQRYAPHWVLFSIAMLCFFFAGYQSWHEEHIKVLGQRAYMKITIGGQGLPSSVWSPNQLGIINFQKHNQSGFLAEEESTVKETIIRQAPSPLVGPFTPNNIPSSPKIERLVFAQMLNDVEHDRHAITTIDPGETDWASSETRMPLSQDEWNRTVISKEDIIYVVGLEKWKDDAGIHARSFCYWMHPPVTNSQEVAERCYTNNDYIDDATKYVKYFKQPE